MSEKILKIEEVTGVEIERAWSDNDGFAITTDKQIVKLLISNNQSCCENWGYFLSEDKFDQFIGAELLGITITDTALNTIDFTGRTGPDDLDMGGMMFVNINTNKGLLQFVAYNAHNGYYGHTAYVISEQLNYEEGL